MLRISMPYLVLALVFWLTATIADAAPKLLDGAAPAGIVQVTAGDGGTREDTDLLFQLAMLEGHLIIGHDLVAANQPALGLPHFGHPVHELYDDISPYLAKKHLRPFDTQLIKLETAVASTPASPETEAQYQAILVTLREVRQSVPAQISDSVPEMIKICSDTIDAASGEFGNSLNQGRIESIVEYHDSRGYIAYVAQEVDHLQRTHQDTADQGLIARFKAVLAKAQFIVEPLLPDAAPRASVDQYRAIAAEAADLTTH
jgi:hypothetical protein